MEKIDNNQNIKDLVKLDEIFNRQGSSIFIDSLKLQAMKAADQFKLSSEEIERIFESYIDELVDAKIELLSSKAGK